MTPDEHPEPPTRPVHTRPLLWAVVAAGGVLGTGTRDLVSRALPHPTGGWPFATLAVNLVGAFVLGLLLEALVRGGPDGGWRRLTRLGVGTGLCGALTTYSTFGYETLRLHEEGASLYAVLNVVATLLAGLGAALLGYVVGAGV